VLKCSSFVILQSLFPHVLPRHHHTTPSYTSRSAAYQFEFGRRPPPSGCCIWYSLSGPGFSALLSFPESHGRDGGEEENECGAHCGVVRGWRCDAGDVGSVERDVKV
jgi:hypothetical protein